MPNLPLASTVKRMVIALRTAWQANREGLIVFAIGYAILLALTLAILTFGTHWTIASINDLLVVAGIVFALVFIAARSVLNDEKKARERRQELRHIAARMSAKLSESASLSQYPQLQSIGILDKEGWSKNLLTGEVNGFVWRFFDFEYDAGSDDGGANYKTHSVMCLESETLTFPTFSLKPTGIFHQLAANVPILRPTDIKLDGWRSFNERFVLQGGRRSGLLAAFNPDVVWFFKDHPDLHTAASSHVLLIYRKQVECTPEYIPAFLDMALTLAKLLLSERKV